MEKLTSFGGSKMVREHELLPFMRLIANSGAAADNLWFACIGSDRSSGDSLGPLTGTLLAEAGYGQVVGRLDEPCDAEHLPRMLERIPAGSVVLAIDASVGREDAVGYFRLVNGPLEPGRSMGRRLPSIGDWSIAAVVCENRGNPYQMLQRTSLHRVLTMSRQIVAAVREVFPVRADAADGGSTGDKGADLPEKE